MNKTKLFKQFVCCPNCSCDLKVKGKKLYCSNCRLNFNIIGGILDFISDEQNGNLTMTKWENLYLSESFLDGVAKVYNYRFLSDLKRQILGCANFMDKKNKIFLEIGSGLGYLGEEFAKNGWFFVGVDFSFNALLSSKKRLESNNIRNFLLIHADIFNLPLREESVNLIYGGGVIEHCKNTQIVVNGLYRVLKKGGAIVDSVPFLNFANFFYRLRWGSIPNIPIIKDIFWFIHTNVLKGKSPTFGYELQFSENQLKSLHEKAGFQRDKIFVNRFDCSEILQFDCVKSKRVKNFFSYLCNNFKQFWPAIKVSAIK